MADDGGVAAGQRKVRRRSVPGGEQKSDQRRAASDVSRHGRRRDGYLRIVFSNMRSIFCSSCATLSIALSALDDAGSAFC